MKNFRIYLFLLIPVLAMGSKCNKNKTPGTVKGRLMINCTTPYANSLVKMKTDQGGGSSFAEDESGNKEFFTDANGYFEIKYISKGGNGSLHAPKRVMDFIPIGNGKFTDIGEVNLNGTVNFVIKLQVNNPHTANDTLYYSNWSYPNPSDISLKLAGPFQTGIIDTAINVGYSKVQIYNEIPKLNMTYYINTAEDNTIYFNTPICSSQYGEVTFVIN